MIKLDEIQKLTVDGQSVKEMMAEVERAVKGAASLGETSARFVLSKKFTQSKNSWRLCVSTLRDEGFVVDAITVDEGPSFTMNISWPMKALECAAALKPSTLHVIQVDKEKVVPETPTEEVLHNTDISIFEVLFQNKYTNRCYGRAVAFANVDAAIKHKEALMESIKTDSDIEIVIRDITAYHSAETLPEEMKD